MERWRRFSKEKPKAGDEIFVIECHWKENYPGSYRMYGGEVEVGYSGEMMLQTNDDYGEGSWALELGEDNYWIPANELTWLQDLLKLEHDSPNGSDSGREE